MNTHSSPLNITSSADMVAVLPILIGRHPRDEVFAVGFDAESLRAMGSLTLDKVGEIGFGAVAAYLNRHEVTEVFLIGYGPAETIDMVVAAAHAAYVTGGLGVRDTLRIHYGYRTSYRNCALAKPVDTDSVLVKHLTAAMGTPLAKSGWGDLSLEPVTGLDARRMDDALPATRERVQAKGQQDNATDYVIGDQD